MKETKLLLEHLLEKYYYRVEDVSELPSNVCYLILGELFEATGISEEEED